VIGFNGLTDHVCHTEFDPRYTSLYGPNFRVSIIAILRTIVLVNDGEIECGNTTGVVVAVIRE